MCVCREDVDPTCVGKRVCVRVCVEERERHTNGQTDEKAGERVDVGPVSTFMCTLGIMGRRLQQVRITNVHHDGASSRADVHTLWTPPLTCTTQLGAKTRVPFLTLGSDVDA